MLLGSVWYHLTTRGFFCRIWRGSVIAELAGIVRCDYLVSVYTYCERCTGSVPFHRPEKYDTRNNM